jgi:hypothetical protein
MGANAHVCDGERAARAIVRRVPIIFLCIVM